MTNIRVADKIIPVLPLQIVNLQKKPFIQAPAVKQAATVTAESDADNTLQAYTLDSIQCIGRMLDELKRDDPRYTPARKRADAF
jgi:hypothetical protein